MKIMGDYHTHTNFSDGKNTVVDMVKYARDLGIREIAIADHGFSKIFSHLKRKDFEKYKTDIEQAKSALLVLDGLAKEDGSDTNGNKPLSVLRGVEANLISTDGRIDVDEDIRDDFQIVLCGIHPMVFYTLPAFFKFFIPNCFFRLIHFTPAFQIRYNTGLVKKAIDNNKIDIWTHPNTYFKVDVVEIAKTCAARGTLIELSGKHLDFRPIDFERMAKTGVKFIISSDAHNTKRIAEFARVEEFLKNCDYNEKDIVNIGQTYTEYLAAKNKPEKETEDDRANKDGNKDIDTKKRRWRFF